MTALPAIIVLAFSVALWAWGPWVINRVGITDGMAHVASGLKLVNSLHARDRAGGGARPCLFLRDSATSSRCCWRCSLPTSRFF